MGRSSFAVWQPIWNAIAVDRSRADSIALGGGGEWETELKKKSPTGFWPVDCN